MRRFLGVPASSGVASGPWVRLAPLTRPAAGRIDPALADEEIGRLHAAVATAAAGLDVLAGQVAADGHPDEGAIFAAHAAMARDPALVVVLDGVEDPRNLGAILRTAEAAGADGVLLPERHSAGLSETVARASAGALEHVRVARVGNLVQALEALKARGIWVVGFDAAGTERWDAVDLGRPVALVLGGEGRGIRRLVREHCDHLVSIPHFGHIGSLNVSVAAGIALYEAVRQRRSVPSGVRPIPSRPASAPQIEGPAPGDDEEDPGARPMPPPGAHEHGADEEEPFVPVTHVDPHDDVAWGQGPTVLKSVGFNRARRPDGRRNKGRRRPPAAALPASGGPPRESFGPPPAPGAPTGAAPGGGAGDPGVRRKGQRRRRGRRDGRGPGQEGPPRSEPAPPGAAPAAGDRQPGEGRPPGTGEGERPGGRGRRRRRRGRR